MFYKIIPYCLLIILFLFIGNVYSQDNRIENSRIVEELDELEANGFGLANNLIETTFDDVSININRNNNINWEVGSTISDITESLTGVLNTGIITTGSVINTGITTAGSVANTAITTLPETLNAIMELLVSSQEQLHDFERRIGEDINYLLDTSILKILRDALATRFGTLAFGGTRSIGRAVIGDVSGNNIEDLSEEDIINMYKMDKNHDGKITIREMRQAVRENRKKLNLIQRVFNIVTRLDMLQARQDRKDYNKGNINKGSVYDPIENGYFSNRPTQGSDGNTQNSIQANSNLNSSIYNDVNTNPQSNKQDVSGSSLNNNINVNNQNESGSASNSPITLDHDGISIASDTLSKMVGEKVKGDCNKVIHDFVVTCAEKNKHYKIESLENESGGNLTADKLLAEIIPGYVKGSVYSPDLMDNYNIPESIYRILLNRPSNMPDSIKYYVSKDGIEEVSLSNTSCRQDVLPKVCYVNENDKTDVTILYFGEGKEYCGENLKNDGVFKIDYMCNDLNID
jgi:hypothetical protein